MSRAKYQSIADDLRRRIVAREWKVGEVLPPIWKLQKEYEVKGLNTIRDAQRLLVRDGVLRPEQGVGVHVIAIPRHPDKESAADLVAELKRLVMRLEAVLEPA
jgi:DNA-binding GntR family transcriptional regulator